MRKLAILRAGLTLADSLVMDDDGRHIDARKRQLIDRAAKLLGQDELARRLNVASPLLEAWLSGDATLPDGKLMELARVLDSISREERKRVE